jgi:hypothetical protein
MAGTAAPRCARLASASRTTGPDASPHLTILCNRYGPTQTFGKRRFWRCDQHRECSLVRAVRAVRSRRLGRGMWRKLPSAEEYPGSALVKHYALARHAIPESRPNSRDSPFAIRRLSPFTIRNSQWPRRGQQGRSSATPPSPPFQFAIPRFSPSAIRRSPFLAARHSPSFGIRRFCAPPCSTHSPRAFHSSPLASHPSLLTPRHLRGPLVWGGNMARGDRSWE